MDLHVYEVPVEYQTVQRLITALWKKHSPQVSERREEKRWSQRTAIEHRAAPCFELHSVLRPPLHPFLFPHENTWICSILWLRVQCCT